MKTIALLLAVVTGVTLVTSACSPSSASRPGYEVKVNGGSYRRVTAVELQTMLRQKDFLLVNVHVPAGPGISGTDTYVPYDAIQSNISRFLPDKASKIVVYCRSGNMSTTAAGTLVGMGFTNVWELDGGMLAWEKQGYTLTQSSP